MKCPFRKNKQYQPQEQFGLDGYVIEEEYAECYGRECPFYFEVDGDKEIYPSCFKANNIDKVVN